jgi:hypothetical protein
MENNVLLTILSKDALPGDFHPHQGEWLGQEPRTC